MVWDLCEEISEIKNLEKWLTNEKGDPHREVTPPLASDLLVGASSKVLVEEDDWSLNKHANEEVRGEGIKGETEDIFVEHCRDNKNEE